MSCKKYLLKLSCGWTSMAVQTQPKPMVQAKSGNRYNRPKKQHTEKKKKKESLKWTQVTQPKNHKSSERETNPLSRRFTEGAKESEEEAMADNREILAPQYDVNAKWDACIDLTVRRFVYSTLGGAVGGLLLFSQFFLLLSLSLSLFLSALVSYLASVKIV